jgi:hypothetical protein
MEEKTQRNLWQWVRVAVAIIGSVLVISGILINQAICTAGGFVAVMLVFYLTFRSNRLREAWFNHSMTTVVRNIERANNYASQRIPIGIGSSTGKDICSGGTGCSTNTWRWRCPWGLPLRRYCRRRTTILRPCGCGMQKNS